MALSELENAVLGVVWRRAPCTAYVVQTHFALVSAAWSASPGSVYPLMKKLRRLRLVSERRQKWGARTRALYTLTNRGKTQLESWVSSVPEWIGRPQADPIRTRTFYLDALDSNPKRVAVLRKAEAATKVSLREVQNGIDTLAPGEQSFESMAQTGALFQLRARLAWLAKLIAHHSDQPKE